MNIFEQYGIKEVADITFYAITLNKYGEEIYVPVMYFDTLKVSTLEQTAQETSATGGKGNAELISWDFGKAISLKIEDALYNPASQSLMWGGKFGIKNSKIYGVWNPYIYPKDRFGKYVYLDEYIATYDTASETYSVVDKYGKPIELTYSTEEELLANDFHKVICICDGSIKYIKRFPNNKGHYKYLRRDVEINPQEDQLIPIDSLCPLDKIIHDTYTSGPIERYAYDYNSAAEPEKNQQFKSNKWKENKTPELAELIVDNFINFDYKNYIFRPFGSNNEHCYYEEVPICDSQLAGCTNQVDAYGYIWNKADIKMTSLQGDQDIYFAENMNVKYRLLKDCPNKEVSISTSGIFKNSDEYLTNEIFSYNEEDLIFNSIDGLVKKDKPFNTKIDFFTNIKWDTVNEGGQVVENITKVKIGTFYILEDWNYVSESPYEMIYPINDGLERVKMLERMEKCTAKKTFAIDTDKNLAMYNYSQSKEYDNSSIIVYIDPRTMKPYEPNSDHFYKKNGDLVEGNLRIVKQNSIFYRWSRTIAPKHTALGHRIIVDAEHYPCAFKVVGETFARTRVGQKDQRYQFEIPICKLSSNTSLQLEADGAPTTFTMELKVLRKDDGTMMRLTQYNIADDEIGGTVVVPIDGSDTPEPEKDNDRTYWTKENVSENGDNQIKIINPNNNTPYHLEEDLDNPYYCSEPYVDSSYEELEQLNRSNIVVEEKWKEYKKSVYTEYYDRERTQPTGEVTEQIDEVVVHSKVLTEEEYEFTILSEENNTEENTDEETTMIALDSTEGQALLFEEEEV